MPEETASLRDVTVSGSSADARAAETAETKPAEEKPPEVSVVDQSEKEAAELGRLLMGSGYSKEQLNQLLDAPRALKGLQDVIRSGDGRQIIQLLRQSGDAEAAARMEQSVADYYVEQYENSKRPGAKESKEASGDSELMAEVKELRGEVTTMRTNEQRRQEAAALASMRQRYNGRIDDIFNQDGIKALGLTPSEQKNIRARLDVDLAADPDVVARASRGNFVDVAPAFKRIIDERAADIKAKSEAERQAREGVRERGNFSFPGGPVNVEVPAAASESWEATEEALAKALQNL